MKHPTYQAMPTVSKIHKYPTFHHVYLWQRSLYGVGYYRHLSLHKGTNQLLEGPECQTDLCKITTTLWSRSLRLKSSKLQLHLIYAWSWSNQSSQGPRSSDLGFLFKSTASTTHRKNGRKKERKKETNKLRKETSLLLTLQLPSDELGIWLRSFWLFERELRIYMWIWLISRSFYRSCWISPGNSLIKLKLFLTIVSDRFKEGSVEE